jgi:hypothetical protein
MVRIQMNRTRFRRLWTRWFGSRHLPTTAERFRQILQVEQLEGMFLPNLLFMPGMATADVAIAAADEQPAAEYAQASDSSTADQAVDIAPACDQTQDADPTTTTPPVDTTRPDQPPTTPPRADDPVLQYPAVDPLQEIFATSDSSSDVPSSGTFAPSISSGSVGGNASVPGIASSNLSSTTAAGATWTPPALRMTTVSEDTLAALASSPLSLGTSPPTSGAPAPAAAGTAPSAAAGSATASAPAPTGPTTPASPATAADVSAAFGQLPLAFEPNHGQFAPGTIYQTNTTDFTVDLNATSATFGLASAQGNAAVVSMNLVGGNAAAASLAGTRLPGSVNYLFGKDPSGWIRDVPRYTQVAFQNVYPGIDLVYHQGGTQQQLEYDFVVAPGADPGAIQLAFGGAPAATLDPAGNLVLATSSGDLVQQAPVVYQPAANGGRVAVDGSFALLGNNQVGFKLGAYDPTQPLVIDPIYSTFLGNTVTHQVNHVAVDAAGSAYVVGTRTFPHIDNCTPNTMDAFAAKLDPAGNLVYMTYVGGTQFWPGYCPPEGPGNEAGNGIAVDQFGQANITGWTSSTDFPIAAPPGVTPYQTQITFNPYTNPRGAVVNAFLTKLNAAGNGLVYSTYVGRTNYGDGMGFSCDGISYPHEGYTFNEWEQYGQAVAVDNAGNAYFVGYTTGIQAIAQDLFDPPAPGDPFHIFDAFLHRINTVNGSATIRWNIWTGDHACTGTDVATGVALDPTYDHVFATGYTTSSDLLITPNAFQPTNHSASGGGGGGMGLGGGGLSFDAFVVKIDLPGSLDDTEGLGDADSVNQVLDFDYSTYLGGIGDDRAYDIAVDASSQAYVTGGTTDDSFPTTPNAYQTQSTSEPWTKGAAFVTVLNFIGTAEVYSTLLGGTDTVGRGIALDSNDLIYVTGETTNPPDPPSYASAQAPPEWDAPPQEVEDGVATFGTFPLTANNTDPYARGGPRAFLTTIPVPPTPFIVLPPTFSTFHGGENTGRGVAVDPAGEPVIGGFGEDDMILVNPILAFNIDNEETTDGFVAKWAQAEIQGG